MCCIKVAARDSLLSQRQVKEVFLELKAVFSDVVFETTFMKTTGDLALDVSLLHLDKTDFFTKELDVCVLEHRCDVAIHSAKDLPDPLPRGLEIYAITRGVDPSDVLVLREGESINTLASQAKIGISSHRRREALHLLREDLTPLDIRGNIQRRLELLMERTVDGVIIAEAALIRLGLTHLNRIVLPGETAPMQGRLAVVGRVDHPLLQQMFKTIHGDDGNK